MTQAIHMERDLSTAGGGHMPPPPSRFGAKTEETPSRDIFTVLAEFADIASLLRISGALTVIAAMSAFLMQDWSDVTDNSRFYMLLAQTVLLTFGGFGLSFLMKENKGARVFFGLGLLSIVANMATLAALIFSVTQWSGAIGSYPSFAHWRAVDGGSLMLMLAAGIAVAIPTAVFGFMVLARASSKKLALMFLFTNALMLLPVRDSGFVGLIAMAGVLLPLIPLVGMLREDASLRTKEGWFALAAVFAPIGIIVVRDLMLYQLDDVTQMALALTGFFLIRGFTQHREQGMGWFLALVSLGLAMAAAISLASLLPYHSTMGSCALFGLAYGALGFDVARRCPNHAKLIAWLTALPVGFIEAMAFFGSSDSLGIVLFLAAGLSIAAMGRAFASRGLMNSGICMVAVGLFCELRRIMDYVDFSHWLTLAILGASAIIIASVIERHGAVLKLKWQQLAARKEELETLL